MTFVTFVDGGRIAKDNFAAPPERTWRRLLWSGHVHRVEDTGYMK